MNEIVQALYQLTQDDIKNENGEDITYQDMQDMFYQCLEYLADTLGIELNDK